MVHFPHMGSLIFPSHTKNALRTPALSQASPVCLPTILNVIQGLLLTPPWALVWPLQQQTGPLVLHLFSAGKLGQFGFSWLYWRQQIESYRKSEAIGVQRTGGVRPPAGFFFSKWGTGGFEVPYPGVRPKSEPPPAPHPQQPLSARADWVTL